MATEIVVTTWCDVHLYENNEYVAAESRHIPVPGAVKTVDLCDEHDEQILGPVRKLYEDFGVKPDATPRASAKDGARCPVCGSSHTTNYGMRQHVRRRHPDKAAEVLDLHGKGYPCTEDGCEFEAVAPQGLGAHLRQAHGIKGKTNLHRRPELAEAV